MTVTIRDPEVKADLLRRLRRVEGQARGVARMIEEGRDCQEILQQLAAIRAAAHQTSLKVVQTFALECATSNSSTPEEMAEALVQAMSRLS